MLNYLWVGAGTFNTTYETLREGIQIGTSRRKSERFHAGAFENLSELLREQGGSVMEQESSAEEKAVAALVLQ
ncbi:MAG TPA: hypothetical protein VEL06_13390 [Haliangiales bacterium]|nr:hypothetical protein [Haliangiales bacterium]